jgi:hypothetical protein
LGLQSGSKRSKYVRSKISCVERLISQLEDPHGKGEPYPVKLLSKSGAPVSKTLYALIEHYVLPSIYIKTVKVKEKAIEFLTNCCALWYR